MSKTALVNRADRDPVSTVLKWVLLVVGFATAMLLFWTTLRTYQGVPPQPQRFVSRSGDVIMTADDIIAGKGGFQKADLMDYGSLYGMGSYYGEDYTASLLKNIALSTRENYAHDVGERTFSHLSPEKQTVATTHMREDLRGIDLTQDTVVLPDAVSHAFVKIRDETAASFLTACRQLSRMMIEANCTAARKVDFSLS